MKTEISRFCEASLNILQVLPPALKNAAENMEKVGDPALLHQPLAVLNDLRARLRSLVEKLGNQQAYLLIFGPLKSGKSTLMNAISGSYVSEVTSLPGYPCLVYVQHAPEAHFSVTRYNGRESVFANGSVLRDVIADSHLALAQQIRATEERGSEFDPRTHFSEAIRRIDVKVPVPSLEESSTVLVDTPGLYSRMNFGYDVLTREFRNSAACAVFVVKTDNLFLEQVFNEFNQLLGLFSRIFLVINVDSSKRDLQADGSLQPSAESQHPEQIIEAFKTLSMAGPLRQAYEKNRVRIHAVDLLSAASAFLSHTGNGSNGQKNSFDAFQRDLTDYLNSSDYTLEFIRDSLRQGHTMCSEVREIFEGGELGQLRETQSKLENEMREINDRIAAVNRLLDSDWESTFEKVRVENAERCEAGARSKATDLRREMGEALDRWYQTNESLLALQDRYWNPLLVDAARSLGEDTRSRLTALLDTPRGGAEPIAAVMADLHEVSFSLAPSAQAALPKLNEKDPAEAYQTTLRIEDVPVRKSFADWLLFRGMATVRRRLFGEDLAQEIAPEVKQKRLADAARAAFSRVIDSVVNERLPLLPGRFAEKSLAGYIAQFRGDVLDRLRQGREQMVRERADRQSPFEVNTSILNSVEELNQHAGKVAAELELLAEQENALPLSGGGATQLPADEPVEVERLVQAAS
ncbi:MAG: hypothetical protein QOE70_1037 [Chthoniobacter sp.]|jgi:GTPase SAR1 family protein|nr:hypothetical protein [Chthoniobacter sp.]